MSLPPERVSIKRKRDAETVDVLFIQDKKRARLQQFVFKRVSGEGDSTSTCVNASNDTRLRDMGSSQRPPTTEVQDAGPKVEAPSLIALRRFHLQRPLIHPTGLGMVPKRSNPQPSARKLAIFLEKRAAGPRINKQPPAPQPASEGGLKNANLQAARHLRPRASAAELRWREENWHGPRAAQRSGSRGPAPDPEDAAQLKLAQELHDFALEETAKTGTVQPDSFQPGLSSHASGREVLKFQPKLSATRNRRSQQDVDMSDSDDMNLEWEYDTYVRVELPNTSGKGQPATTDNLMDIEMHNQAQALQGRNIGVLVIEDEDEELWARYAEDEEDDVEFDTDNEDENAEDYYGNDYPEDELESDDEFDRAPYGYRHAGSDDEQFGEEDKDGDEPEFLGNDDEGSEFPGPAPSSSWINEFTSPVQNRALHPY